MGEYEAYCYCPYVKWVSTRPTVTAPTRPTVTALTTPTVTAPTRPTVTAPTRPTVTAPTRPTVTAPTRPTVTALPSVNSAFRRLDIMTFLISDTRFVISAPDYPISDIFIVWDGWVLFFEI